SSRSRSRAWFFSFRPVPVPPNTGRNCGVWRYGKVGLSLQVLQPAPVLISLDLAPRVPLGEDAVGRARGIHPANAIHRRRLALPKLPERPATRLVLLRLDLAASKPFGEEILRPVHRGGVIPPWALPPNQEANDEEDHSDPEQENQGPENTRSTGSGMCHRCQRKDVHGCVLLHRGRDRRSGALPVIVPASRCQQPQSGRQRSTILTAFLNGRSTARYSHVTGSGERSYSHPEGTILGAWPRQRREGGADGRRQNRAGRRRRRRHRDTDAGFPRSRRLPRAYRQRRR